MDGAVVPIQKSRDVQKLYAVDGWEDGICPLRCGGNVKPATEADVNGKLEGLQRLMGQFTMPEDGEFSEEEMDKYVSGVPRNMTLQSKTPTGGRASRRSIYVSYLNSVLAGWQMGKEKSRKTIL